VLTADVLEALLGAGIVADPRATRLVEGGSINACYRVAARDGRAWFLKLNEPDCADMFAAEAEGLRELAAAGAVRVPRVVARGTTAGATWLALEWLELGPPSPAAAARLGTALATQHRHAARQFGWHRDNVIGTTLQRNVRQDDWLVFLRQYRLGFQLRLAAGDGDGGGAELEDKGARLLEALPRFFEGYRPTPALLHGDLWGGNWGTLAGGEPVVFDPAVYYGDREADVAMTELFGGFPAAFYVAYRAAWPLDAGYEVRRDIYNLYHVLNHLNLFGGAYRRQALALLDRLLSRPL
jgi:fructosamine-3-kinase